MTCDSNINLFHNVNVLVNITLVLNLMRLPRSCEHWSKYDYKSFIIPNIHIKLNEKALERTSFSFRIIVMIEYVY
jgi:hypothetical protein